MDYAEDHEEMQNLIEEAILTCRIQHPNAKKIRLSPLIKWYNLSISIEEGVE
jgi:hypothetical protein